MRVLVLGAGATGGYFGARMHEAGASVSFLVRPHRAAQLSAEGLQVHSSGRKLRAVVEVLTRIEAGQAWDIVLLSCKSYDLPSALEAIGPAVGAGARVLPLLNGIRHLDVLDKAFGRDCVLGGLCHVSAVLQEDGSILQVGSVARLTFGERQGAPLIEQTLLDELRALPFDVIHSADVMSAMWEKFAFLSALAGITCLTRASIGEIVAVPDGADLVQWLYLECVEVARRSGHARAGMPWPRQLKSSVPGSHRSRHRCCATWNAAVTPKRSMCWATCCAGPSRWALTRPCSVPPASCCESMKRGLPGDDDLQSPGQSDSGRGCLQRRVVPAVTRLEAGPMALLQ